MSLHKYFSKFQKQTESEDQSEWEIINCTSFEKCFIISYTSSNQSRDCEEDESLHRSPSLSPVLSRISSFSPDRSPPLSPESSPPLSSALPLSSKSMTPSESPEPPSKQLRLATEVDIGVFVSERGSGRPSDSSVNDDDKYNLIVNHPTPSATDVYPSGSDGRRFQSAWFTKYQWLRYSKHDNGGYYLPCVLFARSVNWSADPGALVNKPLVNFRRALELLRLHAEKMYHKTAVVSFEAFQKVMTKIQPSIARQINLASQQLVDSNRLKLRSIVETVLLCGRQNISFRGHRDSSCDVENCPNAPHGNFWALLDFRVSAGDGVLRDHLAKAPANAKYTSPSIQNEVADILGTQIKRNILDRVRRAKFFSVVADEVTDSSNKEQLALAYVDPGNLQIREDLVEFIECDTGVTGSAIAEKITGFIQSSGLDPTKLRGQAYDGAGNMAGKTNGAAAIITRDYPLASYLHCASHSLNLAVVKSLEVQSVRNMIGIITRVSLFFHAHPKRQRKLEEAVDSIAPTSSVHKLKDLCHMRWVERIDALQRFKDLFSSVVSCRMMSSRGLKRSAMLGMVLARYVHRRTRPWVRAAYAACG